jgi:hypothetical protein
MVDSVAATLEAIVANGGEVVQPIGADSPEITVRFRDPGRKRDRPIPTPLLTEHGEDPVVPSRPPRPESSAAMRTFLPSVMKL